MKYSLFDLARIFHADHHLGQHVFVDARWCEVIGGADLPQVGENGCAALRAVDGKTRNQRLGVGEKVVAHPGHGQIGEHLLPVRQVFPDNAVARRDDDIVVGQHNTLRVSRGTRGVEHDGNIRPRDPVGRLLEKPRIGLVVFAPDGLGILDTAQEGKIVVAHASRIVKQDVPDARILLSQLEQLIDLLLVFGERIVDVGIVQDELHLLGD